MNPSPRTPRRRASFLFAAILALLPVAGARAQGTEGTLPDPISARQLDRYGDWLRLSQPQRLALESLHAEYRRDFRTLREGEIAEFVRQYHAMQGGGVPRRDEVETFLEQMDVMIAKIRVLDERFFDRAAGILSESQAARLPRVRLARERQRYEALQQMTMMGRPVVDLSTVFLDLELPADADAGADAIMARYEQRLTAQLRTLGRAASRMMLDVMDALEERGFTDLTEEELGDPARLAEMMQAMRDVFADLARRSNDISSALRRLNRTTCADAGRALPEATARRFRNAYYRAEYAELGSLVRMDEEHWFGRALALEDLPAGQRETLQAIEADYRVSIDRLIEEGAEIVEAMRERFSPLEVDSEAAAQSQAALRDLRERGEALVERTLRALQDGLGEEVVERIRNAVAEQGTAPKRAMAEAAARNRADATVESVPDETMLVWAVDPSFPSPIARVDVAAHADLLELDEGLRSVLRELHADYLERAAALEAVDALRAANESLWTRRGESALAAPSEEAIDDVAQMRRRAVEAIAAVDDAFFADVGLGVARPDQAAIVDRWRRTRLRHRCRRAARATWGFGSAPAEAAVDLGALLETPVTEEAAAIVDAYERGSMDALRARFDAQLEFRHASDRWTATVRRARSDVTEQAAMAQRYREIMTPATTMVEAADRTLIELNREGLEALARALPEDRARGLRRAYDRAAFPSVYEDSGSVEHHLAAALAADDLSPTQREQIQDLAAGYRPEYERLCDAIRDIVRDGPGVDAMSLDRAAWRDHVARQERITTIQFDRNELNDRTRGRLEAILDEGQRVRLEREVPRRRRRDR